jgi:hypothetical protein
MNDDSEFCPVCLGAGSCIDEVRPCHAGPYYNGGFTAIIDNGQVAVKADQDSPHKTKSEALKCFAQRLYDNLGIISMGSQPEEDIYNLVHKENRVMNEVKIIDQIPQCPMDFWQAAAHVWGQAAVDKNPTLAGEIAQEMKAAGWTFSHIDDECGEEVWRPPPQSQ